MKFYKYTGLGNDFVFIDGADAQFLASLSGGASLTTAEFARRICCRQTGVGADGLVLLLPPDRGDVKMRIWNADGSEAEMCGNASRCVALHCQGEPYRAKKTVVLDTLAGPIVTEIINRVDENRALVRVDMGAPRLLRGQIPMTGNADEKAIAVPVVAGGKEFIGTAVSMGNPHFVIFVNDLAQTPVETWGPELEKCAAFPQKTNVEFVQILDKNTVRMRVWERGAGITRACGTGACATAVACALNGKTAPNITVQLDGGNLQIAWGEQDHLLMTGPARLVYVGGLVGNPYGREIFND